MKISGFTFVRNAVKYDYPIVEAITSILPICEEMIVLIGNSDDNTTELIQNIKSDKIKIVYSVWDDSLREGGKVLAVETNKAFQEIQPKADWAFYIQADEVVHEKYHKNILEACEAYVNDKNVDGLLFKYKHFYGSYDYIGASNRWYKNEIRIIRNNKNIYSFKDAQGFRKDDNQKLNVKPIDAYIYHYGWVKHPEKMKNKVNNFHSYWHKGDELEKRLVKSDTFDYSEIDSLQKFTETHPKVMQERIKQKNWTFDYDISYNKANLKDKIKNISKKILGREIGEYRNYKII
ncbi:MAG: glycosyltransferase family 2 protein [Ignavibacteria bacterium]|jgi:hypothetical protein|nr:glycosyltransferase family 2 protein [Ignavibacteria bacterium]